MNLDFFIDPPSDGEGSFKCLCCGRAYVEIDRDQVPSASVIRILELLID
jgi:hypothetical protein